jgi:hypothetical protein
MGKGKNLYLAGGEGEKREERREKGEERKVKR